VEQDLAPSEPARPHLSAKGRQILLLEPGKKNAPGEGGDDGLRLHHPAILPTAVTCGDDCRYFDRLTVYGSLVPVVAREGRSTRIAGTVALELEPMRLTVVGSGPAAPQPDTAASGHLVETDEAAILLDCGYGVMSRLRTMIDPLALDGVVIGHFHADHFLDLAALRYVHPWPGSDEDRPQVWLPGGGRQRLAGLAAMMSERQTFFEDAFDIHEYESEQVFTIGDLTIRPSRMHHYVPAWAMTIIDGEGARLVYGGDTGPHDQFMRVARDADLLIAEATLASADEDELNRGHCTAEEALIMAREANVRRVVLTHYPSARRPALTEIADQAPMPTMIAKPGVEVDIGPAALPVLDDMAIPEPAPSRAFPGRPDVSRAV